MKENKPDFVFFLWIDSFLNPYLRSWVIDLIFRFKWTGLYFHPRHLRFNKCRFTKLSKPDNIFKSRFCQFIMTLDENIANKLSTNTDKTIYVLPDITDETISLNTQTKRDILNLAGKRKVIGLFGVISKRKGLSSFIEVIKKAEKDKYFFIIAGNISLADYNKEQTEIINSFLNTNHNNCLFILKKIEDGNDFNTLIESCDILLAVYEDFFHSSNILTKASLFNKFIIVSDKHLMSERVRKFQTGICVMQENSDELLRALETLSESEGVAGEKLNPKFKEYFSEHSQAKLKQVLAEINI